MGNKLEKLHQYEAEAFQAFIKVCEENNLEYYAIGGTLLGAVRHKGFIPWDDDVDVAMPRKSYDRFVKIAPKVMPKHLIVDEIRYDKNFKSYFAKIRNKNIELRENLVDNKTTTRVGYLIDIIPMDGTPNNKFLRKIYYTRVLLLRFMCGAANVSTGIRTSRPKKEQMLLHVCKFLRLYKILKIERIYKRMDKLFHAQNYDKSKFVGTITGAYNVREIVPKEYIGSFEKSTLWDFEGFKIRGPEKCDKYLTHMFGNYMELPPKSARKIHYQDEIIEKKEA